MLKELLKEVEKVWGKEIILVNNDLYCGKLLLLNKGSLSSYHHHKKKTETFYGLKGQVALTIEGKDYMLNPFSRPKTIIPGQKHQFYGITDATILEISTPHSDDDVYRETESSGAVV